MSKRLTALQVQNIKPGSARREVSDGGSGLYLVVQSSGHKSWAVRFRVNGIPRKLTLPAGLSLAEAREQAAAAIKEAHQGIDPTKAKKHEKQQREIAKANTFAAVAALYLNSHKVQKLRTLGQVRDNLQRLAFPHLGDKPIGEIRRSHIVAALDHIEHHNGARTADHVLSAVRCVLNFHALRDDDYVVPLAKGMNRTDAKDRERTRTLTDDEIRKVWATGDRFARFLLLTAARRGEAGQMQWRELDGNDWTVPASRNKVKVDLVRPLSKAAMSVLGPRGDDDDFVFSVTPGKGLRGFSRIKKRLDHASGVKGWCWHDLRRTARTLLSRAGVNPDHAERCLGHIIGGVRGVYDRWQFRDEKGHALEALAHQIELIVNPPKGNVRQLKRRA
jgi:integrase